MKWLDCVKIRLMFVGIVVAIVLIGGSAKADFTFGEPVNLGPAINTSSDEYSPSVSADELCLYFCSGKTGGYGNRDIWVSTRATKDDPWNTAVNLGPIVNSSSRDAHPCVSADGLSLYFESTRPGGYGGQDLWVTTRATTNDDWGIPVNLGPTVNSSVVDDGPSISADGLFLYFESTRPGGHGSYDLWVTMRATTSDPWGPPVNLEPPVNSSYEECDVSISSDGLLLFFSSSRTGGYELWLSIRPSRSDPWGPAVNLGPPVNSSADEWSQDISSDGLTFYFCSYRPDGYGGGDMWQAPIIPIVDFNGDGYVDIFDLVILVNNWGTDNTLCDIGPMPWGDGIVDESDLNVLMSYWGDDVNDPTLMTNYKLDEAQGDIAYDSAGILDGILNGNPTWQPVGGIIDGALELDGIDDFISMPFVLNPRETSAFSVFLWIKGGLPGQTIISQSNGLNWLAADSAEGCLMTNLKAPTRAGKELLSQVYITDEQWHRIGLVWDGSERILYVDDIEAARDAQTAGLAGCEGGLYIGAGSDLEPGSFFCGLIDDVRIYDRAITP